MYDLEVQKMCSKGEYFRTISERKARPGVNVLICKPPNEVKYYICTLCLELLVQPVQTGAGHRYCRDCYIFLQRTKGICQLCKIEKEKEDCISVGDCFPDNGAKRTIDKFPAECLRCDFKGSMEDLEEHLKIHGY